MADARRMGKSELFSNFAERFEVKRTQARDYFDHLTELAEKELKRSGEFVLPGMVKLVVQKRKAAGLPGKKKSVGGCLAGPAERVLSNLPTNPAQRTPHLEGDSLRAARR